MTRTRMAKTITLTLVVAVLTVAPATPAGAEPAWTPEVDVVAGGHDNINQVRFAVDGAGAATVSWTVNTQDPETMQDRGSVQVATRAPGAAGFGGPEILAEETELTRTVRPRLAVNEAGLTAVVWLEVPQETVSGTLMVATRPPGATSFSPPAPVTSETESAFSTEVVVAPDGTITVLYQRDGEAGTELVSRTREPGAAIWSQPQLISGPGTTTDNMRQVVDHQGNITVAWVRFPDIYTTYRPAGGAFSTPDTIENVDLAWLGDMAVGTDGTVAVGWRDSNEPDSARVSVALPGERFGTGVVVDDQIIPSNGYGPRVSVSPDRTVTMAWEFSRFDEVTQANQRGMRVVTRAPNGDLSRGFLGTPTSSYFYGNADLVATGDGAVTAVWREQRGGGEVLLSSRRPAGGTFGPAVDLMPDRDGFEAFRPQLAADAAGDVTVLAEWVEQDPADPLAFDWLRSMVLDVAGPAITWIASGPGGPGSAVPLAVTATDTWSPPTTSVTWDFGDGSSGSGASTTHVYAAAGAYTVTVTATDAVGNTSTASRSVSVVAPAAPPPPPPAGDTTAPVLTGAKLKPKRLPTGEGARLRVTSSEAATLVGRVQRRKDGRWKAAGSKQWSVRAGANERLFYGKTAQTRLTSGRYRVLLVASDAAGNVSSEVRLRFRVDRG